MDEQQARALLAAERAELLASAGQLDASFDDIVEAARDSNLDDEHDTEGGTIAAERSLVSSLARGAREHLAQIEAAFARLDEGSYGVCIDCERAIADGRLEARPTAVRCIDCARALG